MMECKKIVFKEPKYVNTLFNKQTNILDFF